MIVRADIEAALGAVYDPCSVQANAPLNVINMGLITAIEIDTLANVRISVRPTSPWCTLIGCIMENIDAQVRKVPGVNAVAVEVDRSVAWSEAESNRRRPPNSADHARALTCGASGAASAVERPNSNQQRGLTCRSIQTPPPS